MNKPHQQPTTKNSTWYEQLHKARRQGRQATFIKEMYAQDFSIKEIVKVFPKLSESIIIAIVRQ